MLLGIVFSENSKFGGDIYFLIATYMGRLSSLAIDPTKHNVQNWIQMQLMLNSIFKWNMGESD